MKVYTCQQMKKIEENANIGGMSYIQMMENAGKSCFKKLIAGFPQNEKPSLCIICGKGKNGGDGFVIARYLKNAGHEVSVVLADGMPKADTAANMYDKIKNVVKIYDYSDDTVKALECIKGCDFIVDCIFGIGFRGRIEGSTADLIEKVNSMNKTVAAIDIPSGLEGDSGNVNGTVFKADFTFAVSCLKPVHVLRPASDFCGRVSVIDIGFDESCYETDVSPVYEIADRRFIRDRLVKRTPESNKGTYGKLLCVCGSRNMQGAAVLCTNAAVKSGAGIVISAFPEKAYPAIASKVTEALMLPLKDDKSGFISFDAEGNVLKALKSCTAVVAGCGLGNIEATKRIINCIIRQAKCPIVIDADGINAISSNINILKSASVPVILTPHPGEMSRLTGKTVEEIQEKRADTAKEFAQKYGVTLVLKGNNTVIAMSDGRVFVNMTGNAGMAKGGSGDVLAGITGSFLAQGMSAEDAAVCAVYVHGLSGDLTARRYSMTGMTPSMMIDCLPKLFSNFE